MIPDHLTWWQNLLVSGIPTAAGAAYVAWKWWTERGDQAAKDRRQARREEQGAAKLAEEQVWARIQSELARISARYEREAAVAEWWEAEARRQHDAQREMRGKAADARQALIALQARHGEVAPEWREPLLITPISPPPPQVAGQSGPQA